MVITKEVKLFDVLGPPPREPHVVLVGESTLEAHLAPHVALDEIARGGWDVVVIQDQSTRPIRNAEMMSRDVKTFADVEPTLWRA